MKKSDLQLVRHQSLPKQVAEHVRELIHQGFWREGDRLPTARELAAKWGTDQATVHRALTALVKEGLVERKPRAGTFVRHCRPVLETAGVYLGSGNLVPGAALFVQALTEALRSELEQAGIQMRFLIDPRPKAEQNAPLAEVVQAVERREVQALIVPVTDPEHTAWLSKLAVPVALFSSGRASAVFVDHAHFLTLAIDELARQGRRRLALISAYSPESGDLYEQFADRSADLGFTTRDSWMRIARRSQFTSVALDHHRFGYESVLGIWAGAERPDGLIVTPDGVTMGAVMALLELGVQVPGELSLVLQRNDGVPMLCPLPATLLHLNTRAIAAGLVHQARELHAGRPTERIRVGHELRPAHRP